MTLDQFLEEVALLPAHDIAFEGCENKERGVMRFANALSTFCPLTAVYFAKTKETLPLYAAHYAARGLEINADLASEIIASADGNLGYLNYKQDIRDLLLSAASGE